MANVKKECQEHEDLTQNQKLLDYFKTFPSITQGVAYKLFGIFRLGARIYDLKKKGFEFDSQMIPVKNRFGKTCHVKQYTLKKE